MTKNSAHKQAARAYQHTHPGTSYATALRSVARTRTRAATSTETPPPGRDMNPRAIPAMLAAAQQTREQWAVQAAGPLLAAAEVARKAREQWAAEAAGPLLAAAEMARERLADNFVATAGFPSVMP